MDTNVGSTKKSITRRLPANTKNDTVILAATANAAHLLFGGKTLWQIGQEFDLADEDVLFEENTATVKGVETDITNLAVRVKGQWYRVPFSRAIGSKAYDLSAEDLLNGQFYVRHKQLMNADGTPKFEADGKPALDLKAPYMSFGKAANITLGTTTAAFAEPAPGDDVNNTVA